MDPSTSQSREAQAYSANLDYTLKELQRRVHEHENELERLRSRGDDINQSPAAQVKIIQTALESVTNSEPFLPFASSILPALLALRRTHETIMQSKEYLLAQGAVVDREKRDLEAEEANLRDHKLLTEALGDRIISLEEELSSNADMAPEDGARRRREELELRKKRYDQESRRLFKALNDFIDEHLARMLAAEELGGAVVGELMDIDGNDLAAGFNAQGKPKKSSGKDAVIDDKRQRRIDEIWGAATTRTNGNSDDIRRNNGDDEVVAAGREMKQLTQALVEQLQEARGDNSASYVTLSRESAAARFLVRSKVAQFHPKDASRLRLIDFGREL
ncbi:hypothetical protein GMORB2_7401 [Geosmithia morbida]|uniref:Uncharacterized protein n=1 Tax=Geosmithia morbida TaxID=1094350 RepID=A0A9P4YV80_9HYPO|nr:uncharacterized protein GMORB2_7401 [Geosmithia morbida]KAF4122409.1 hypothetical protein GMORB2_7401 [Geosmithia morbida]